MLGIGIGHQGSRGHDTVNLLKTGGGIICSVPVLGIIIATLI